MAVAVETMVKDPENNFEWKYLPDCYGCGTYVCGFCGSEDGRVGGMKKHIRDNHMANKEPAPGGEG